MNSSSVALSHLVLFQDLMRFLRNKFVTSQYNMPQLRHIERTCMIFNFVTAESRATGQLEYVYYMQLL